MDGQLEAVRQNMRTVKDKIVAVERGLAVAEHAHNALLLSLSNQLLILQEEKNILLRSQAPSKPLPSADTQWLTFVHMILRSIRFCTS